MYQQLGRELPLLLASGIIKFIGKQILGSTIDSIVLKSMVLVLKNNNTHSRDTSVNI